MFLGYEVKGTTFYRRSYQLLKREEFGFIPRQVLMQWSQDGPNDSHACKCFDRLLPQCWSVAETILWSPDVNKQLVEKTEAGKD